MGHFADKPFTDHFHSNKYEKKLLVFYVKSSNTIIKIVVGTLFRKFFAYDLFYNNSYWILLSIRNYYYNIIVEILF